MHLYGFEIRNIKNIEYLKVMFPKEHVAGWHVLLGDNGTGKSSILRAIGLALLGPNTYRSLNLNLRPWVASGKKSGSCALGVMRSENIDGLTGRGKAPWDIHAGFEISLQNGQSAKLDMIGDAEAAMRQHWSDGAGWFSCGFGPFRRFFGGDLNLNRVFSSDAAASGYLSLYWEDAALGESLTTLKEWHYRRLEGDQEAIDKLNNYITFINGSNLLSHGVKIKEVTTDGVSFVDGDGVDVHVSQMSDGFRSMLSMVFELLRRLIQVYGHDQVFANITAAKFTIDLPGIILIDEVDAHLHPTWQVRIGNWFTEYFPQMQFIVTSHSPLICRAAEKGSIWRLATPGTDQVSGPVSDLDRKRLIFGDILDAYGTELFGESVSVSHSPETKRLHERMLALQAKSMDGLTTDTEETELDELRSYL
jgi:predicted ATPase